ncbi:HDOD domain-containing protein [Puniceicoccaceae bacterium K14]|nr:HDOD domain-containing protein [Puniceicoccaceae bacterium K14]
MTVFPENKLDEAMLGRLINSLRPPSAVVMRLMRALQSEDISHDEVEECVNEDPLLAIEAIKLANTANNGGRLKVDSISEALSIIGYMELVRLCLRYSFFKLVPKRLHSYGLDADAYYRKSQVCAKAMDYLGGGTEKAGSHYYTIGLLHSIGEMIIDRYLVLNGLEHNVFEGIRLRPLALVESNLVGYNQAEIAGRILRSWKFDESIVRPIEGQFDLIVEHEYKDAAVALSTARYLTELILEEDAGGSSSSSKTSHMVYKGKSLCRLVDFIREDLNVG